MQKCLLECWASMDHRLSSGEQTALSKLYEAMILDFSAAHASALLQAQQSTHNLVDAMATSASRSPSVYSSTIISGHAKGCVVSASDFKNFVQTILGSDSNRSLVYAALCARLAAERVEWFDAARLNAAQVTNLR